MLCAASSMTLTLPMCVCAYNLFYVKLMERYNKCLPTVSVTENCYYISTKKPWITKGILKCREVKTSYTEYF